MINNFVFSIDDIHESKIDHILFCDKYIYVIMDKYYEGDLLGKHNDESFVMITKDNKKFYTDNPTVFLKKLINNLCSVTGLPTSLIIGLIMVNNDCKMNIESSSKQFFIVQRKKMVKLVNMIETRDIPTMNEIQLANAVKAISNINLRDKKKDLGKA